MTKSLENIAEAIKWNNWWIRECLKNIRMNQDCISLYPLCDHWKNVTCADDWTNIALMQKEIEHRNYANQRLESMRTEIIKLNQGTNSVLIKASTHNLLTALTTDPFILVDLISQSITTASELEKFSRTTFHPLSICPGGYLQSDVQWDVLICGWNHCRANTQLNNWEYCGYDNEQDEYVDMTSDVQNRFK